MSSSVGFGASGASPPRPRRDPRDVRLFWLGLAMVLAPWLAAPVITLAVLR